MAMKQTYSILKRTITISCFNVLQHKMVNYEMIAKLQVTFYAYLSYGNSIKNSVNWMCALGNRI